MTDAAPTVDPMAMRPGTRPAPSGTPSGRGPLPLETTRPGLLAVGDVRDGSMKRVAAAVGEGSAAIRSVHDHLSVPT